MLCTLTIVRYPKHVAFAGFLSMAVFRLPLWLHKPTQFWKLMGCGKNGTFDKTPDWRQWAILTTTNASGTALPHHLLPSFCTKWFAFFKAEVFTLLLTPIESHGLWDGQQPFGNLPKKTEHEGLTAVLTRATIRLNKLSLFWANVAPVANQMAGAKGFITSVGIGEVPWIKQATFSVWETKAAMKDFAYNMQQHKEVIRKTRKENWYSEEMFTRFIPVAAYGTLNGRNPLEGKI